MAHTLTDPTIPATTFVGPADRDPTAIFRPVVTAGDLAGAVALVADHQGTLSHGAVGWADIAARRPMAADTLFWIASTTKPMTGTLTMMVVEDGQLNLDDVVERYLPDFAGLQVMSAADEAQRVRLTKPVRPITVRDCLAHLAGLPFMSRVEAGFIDRLNLREASMSYALTPMICEPGIAFNYSNAGINIVGRILEVVTGQRYSDLMQERLLAPLGMADTSFWLDARQVARLAITYQDTDAHGLTAIPTPQLTYPLDDRHRQASPAGGLFSTAADVARFGRLILAGGSFNGRRLLSEAAVRHMTSDQLNIPGKFYGLGWGNEADEFGHGGAVGNELCISPREGLVKVFMIQQSGRVGIDGAKLRKDFRAAAATSWASQARMPTTQLS